MGFLVLFALAYAAVKAWDKARGSLRESRNERIAEHAGKFPDSTLTKRQRQSMAARHDTGWWVSEAVHGFPVARTGWHSGWLAHRTAALHQRQVREEQRRTHAEVQESLRQATAARAAENLKLIDGELGGKTATRREVADAGAKVLPFARKPEPEPEPEAEAVPPAGPYARTRRPDGQPETDADKRFFDERESGYDGPLNQDGRRPDMSDPQQAGAAKTLEYMRSHASRGEDGLPAPSPATTQGEPVPVQAETTYDQSLAQADGLIREAEEEIARLRMRRTGEWVENLASAAVGGSSVSHLADVHDASQRQIQAAQEQLDSAQAFKADLIRDHGAGAEYHHNTAGGGAEKSFLRE